jgi:hypothetical protein
MDEFFLLQRKKVFLAIFIVLLFFFFFRGLPVTSWGPGTNNRNYSVQTKANVTNAYPEVLNITCNGGANITLTAGADKLVSCIVQARDYSGWNDINYINATFYYSLNLSSDPDDNNTHYTNTSCSQTSNDGLYLINWTCSFNVWYYALNGTWKVNATANDSYGGTGNGYNNASISALLALNVTNLIDYGNLVVSETSAAAVPANVTNLGNVPLNVTVYGYGDDNETLYAGLAMVCQQRNITLSNERYDLSSATAYDSMTRLTGSPATIAGLRIEKQTNPSAYMVNSTYWRLHVNSTTNPFGLCNGTVVFGASLS